MNAKEKLADYQRQFGVYAEANSEVMGAFGATVTAAMNYINAGGTKEDLAAGLNAAVLICGGPGMAYSALALDLFDQYTAE